MLTFKEIIIDSKNRAVQNANSILTLMYWEVGNKINQEFERNIMLKIKFDRLDYQERAINSINGVFKKIAFVPNNNLALQIS